MRLLRDKIFASIAFGHFTVDIINGQRAILLAFLSVPLGLTNTTLGVISTIYLFSASLAQPFFGHLTDRIGPRWVAAGGILWMGVFFTLGLTIQGPISLVFLVVASAGSGAFHPAGAMQATVQGRNHMMGREATAASYFFVFGQMGFFFGPLIGGPLLAKGGLLALLPLVFLTLPVGLMSAYYLRSIKPVSVKKAKTEPGLVSPARVQLGALITLGLIAAFQSMAQQTVNTFVPKYLVDLGQSATTYGMIAAFFMGSSALGNVLGGTLADRFGKKRIIFIAMTLGSIPLFYISKVGASIWLLPIVILTGLFNGAAYSVVVVMAQKTIPFGMGLASGLILGFNYSSGALGMMFGGMLADRIGFPPVFTIASAVALLGGLLALSLKPERIAAEVSLPVEIEGD